MSTIWSISFSDGGGGHGNLFFGGQRDTQMYYNGIDFIINPDRIGDGDVVILGDIRAENFIVNFSGCVDYANKETATMLDPRGYILHNDMDGIPQFRNKKWAFIAVRDVRESMRYVLNNPQMIKDKAKVAYNYVRDKFTYEKTESLFSEMIGQLYNG